MWAGRPDSHNPLKYIDKKRLCGDATSPLLVNVFELLFARGKRDKDGLGFTELFYGPCS